VRAVLRGIRRTIGAAREGKAPATVDVLKQMLALCPDTLIGARDRALLALGFAGAFRRSELCALEVADLTEVPDGLRHPDPAVEGRSGRAGAGGGDSVRLPATPSRGGADVAGGGLDQRRPGVPSCGARRAGIVRRPGADSADRIVKRYGPQQDRLRSCLLRRPQPAQRPRVYPATPFGN
jgi:hypothetical protein